MIVAIWAKSKLKKGFIASPIRDKGNEIYFENSDGLTIDKRPKTDVQKAIELLTKKGLLMDGKILKQ